MVAGETTAMSATVADRVEVTVGRPPFLNSETSSSVSNSSTPPSGTGEKFDLRQDKVLGMNHCWLW